MCSLALLYRQPSSSVQTAASCMYMHSYHRCAALGYPSSSFWSPRLVHRHRDCKIFGQSVSNRRYHHYRHSYRQCRHCHCHRHCYLHYIVTVMFPSQAHLLLPLLCLAVERSSWVQALPRSNARSPRTLDQEPIKRLVRSGGKGCRSFMKLWLASSMSLAGARESWLLHTTHDSTCRSPG